MSINHYKRVFVGIHNMDIWDTHRVEFQPAEPLVDQETAVKVPTVSDTLEERVDELHPPWLGQRPTAVDVEWVRRRQEALAKIREDKGYKFLMLVSAFSKHRIGNMVTLPQSRKFANDDDNSELIPGRDGSVQHNTTPQQFKWMFAPEISGEVHLTANLYGHIKEAESIARLGMPLKKVIELPQYATLFARLVAIRMNLSATLSNMTMGLDSTFKRLHQEQHMVLRQLRQVSGSARAEAYADMVFWTRPH